MSLRLLAPVALGLALAGCIGRGDRDVPPTPPPPPPEASCPELPPPPCDWTEPTEAPPTLRTLEAALDTAWKRLARCAENAATARREWDSCPGNALDEGDPHD